ALVQAVGHQFVFEGLASDHVVKIQSRNRSWQA
ncbi:hypothetical protein RCH09_003193, partial [Actimicrobium sp. GrIS 1.19]|nr:hypothetical protein [Actimicrobium sp. GrIS 1.19]